MSHIVPDTATAQELPSGPAGTELACCLIFLSQGLSVCADWSFLQTQQLRVLLPTPAFLNKCQQADSAGVHLNEENPKRLPITVLLAEDHKQMRVAIMRMLQAEPGIDVVGEAGTLRETLQLAAELKPNIVVIDLHMPGEQDFEPSVVKTQLLLSCRQVLAMSFSQDVQAQALAKSYGATHLLDKMKLVADLLPAILG